MMVVVVVLCFLLCFSFQDFYYEKRNNDNCQTGRSAKAVDVWKWFESFSAKTTMFFFFIKEEIISGQKHFWMEN